MSNEEVQSIIKIGDICICREDGIFREFKGFERCEWQSDKSGFFTCTTCKGRMIFENESNNKITVKCHSHTGWKGENHSDVSIKWRNNKLLPEELFEI